jgi:site-specific DNA recombinase
MRVLGRLRLSRSTDESTSIDRQRELITQWADLNDHTVVGWAEDIDVSGSVDPFDTTQPGDWLGSRAPEFNVIVCWKLDRLSRNTINLNKLFGWCMEHGKSVVSCSESIEISTPVGRLIANVIGFLAEGELEAIRERQRSSKAKLRELGRWSGGKVPYGYTAVTLDGGGWSLEVDQEAARVVRRIVAEFLDGRPLAHIAKGLNEDGIPPSEVYRGRCRGVGRLWLLPRAPCKGHRADQHKHRDCNGGDEPPFRRGAVLVDGRRNLRAGTPRWCASADEGGPGQNRLVS